MCFCTVYNIKVYCYSGGVEVTAFNERAVASIVRSGFEISSEGGYNPIYSVLYEKNMRNVIKCFSKLYDDTVNKSETFAAIMTCSSADQGCPFIVGADVRLPIRYEDPKAFDGTDLMNEKYAERSLEIASEIFYVFSNVNNGK